MSTAALVPVEQYLQLTGKPYQEYRDGVLYPKPMPTKLHSILQRVLLALLQNREVEAYPELTLRTSATRFLIPDVAVAGEFPGPYPPQGSVTLCCEILSPEDRLGAAFAKCEEYHEWGVPYCWIINPEKRTAWQYHKAGEPEKAADALHAGDLAITLRDLFATLPPQ